MKPVSDALRGLLSRQGMHDRTVAAGKVVLNKGRGAASDGALSQVKASNPGGGHGYSPIGRQGGTQPMGNSGKEPRVSASAKFTGLRVVADNSRCMPLRDPTRSAQRGSGIHLVLVH